VQVGNQRLVLDPAVVAAHPRVRELVGEPVIVGIRPEAFSDEALGSGTPVGPVREAGAHAGRVIEATVDLVESLGAELVVHVEVTDIPPLGGDPSESWRQVVGRKGRGVARLGTRSRLAAGDRVSLAVDTAALHLFDVATGASLRQRADQPPTRVARAASPVPESVAGGAGGRAEAEVEARHAGEAADV
jgi:multiple sugar transport system ATP-binding protein